MVNVSSKKRQRGSARDRAIAGREYQVEAILDKRIRGNRTQYLLKWKNYPNEDNTWEDENRLNCPDLFREFEERSKQKTDTKRSTTRRSKNTNMQDADEDFQSIEDQSTTTENGSDSTKIDDDDDDKSDHDRIMTRQSPRKKARLSSPKTSSSTPSRRHSNRITINETKSRITSMSKDESSSGETTEEEVIPKKRSKKPVSVTRNTRNTSNEIPITISDDDDNNHNNNNSTDVSGRKTTTNEPTIQTRRLRVTPSTTSSISFSPNANERNSEKTSAAENCSEIVDETNQVQRIETVRYYHNEISFRIKLIHENEARWISSKIANRKYPQAVIAFWENHVEFT